MAYEITRVDYFYVTVKDKPGEAYQLLSTLADVGINLLAFTAIPAGPLRTQLTLFPEDPHKMSNTAQRAGLELDGPNPALLVQGDDQLGALAEIHEKIYRADVNVYASNGVTDGEGDYGYVIYIRPEDMQKALKALDVER